MVQIGKCDCENINTHSINSYNEFVHIKKYFEQMVGKKMYTELKDEKPLCLYDNLGNTVVQWHPDKYYICNICGQKWALEYPDFPAVGSLYKIDCMGHIIW